MKCFFFGEKPDLCIVRVFGCVAYKFTDTHQHKLSPKATKELFVGYAPMSKAFILFDQKTGKTSASPNVSFNEHCFLQYLLHKESSSSESFPIESRSEIFSDKNVSFTEYESNENLIPSFQPFSQKDFEMSELYSIPSRQNNFEKSDQNKAKTIVKNIEQNIVINTVPQTAYSQNQSFPCSRGDLGECKITLTLKM